MASTIHCVDDEIIGRLERRERRKYDRNVQLFRQKPFRRLLDRSDYPIRASSQPEPLLNVPVISIGPRKPRWSAARHGPALH